jgi:hypothetical protein
MDQISAQATGGILILVALASTMINVSDVITDLQDWHGVSAPSFIGPILKQLGSTVLAAIGGTLIDRDIFSSRVKGKKG